MRSGGKCRQEGSERPLRPFSELRCGFEEGIRGPDFAQLLPPSLRSFGATSRRGRSAREAEDEKSTPTSILPPRTLTPALSPEKGEGEALKRILEESQVGEDGLRYLTKSIKTRTRTIEEVPPAPLHQSCFRHFLIWLGLFRISDFVLRISPRAFPAERTQV